MMENEGCYIGESYIAKSIKESQQTKRLCYLWTANKGFYI